MISVQEAQHFIHSSFLNLEPEEVPLSKARNRILRQVLIADRDFPAYDRVTMDGIAIHYTQFAQGQRSFPIAGIQQAGMPQQRLEDPTKCIEIMTGAVCPSGTDAVIRYEDLKIIEKAGQKVAIIQLDKMKHRQNIHHQGSDRPQGEVLCKPGCRIGAPEIAIAATVGASHLKVSRLPKIAIISTGDELVDVPDTPLPHQIRRSNSYMLAAALEEVGAQISIYHLMDDLNEIEQKIASFLQTYDVLILSGGVSMGKADFVPVVLDKLGVEKLFHKVKQRPGKPFWFGKKDTKVVFALPGNPVSSFVGCHKYIIPWLRKQLKEESTNPKFATLSKAVNFRPALTYFMQANVYVNATGQLIADPIEGHGSGDHANLLRCNALLELPGEERNDFLPGESYPVILFR